jgi:hypothetical protein
MDARGRGFVMGSGVLRRHGSTVALVALSIAVGGSMPERAEAGRTVYAPKDCTKPRVEPGRIVVACADFGLYFKIKRWSYWNRRGAAADAKMKANDCIPSCATGTFRSYPVRIKLSKVRSKRCNGRRVPLFQKLRANFKDRRPPWADGKEKWGLYCIP